MDAEHLVDAAHVAVGLAPGHHDYDAVVAACATVGPRAGDRFAYTIRRSKYDADAPDEALATIRADHYGVVHVVLAGLRERRIKCYAVRNDKLPF